MKKKTERIELDYKKYKRSTKKREENEFIQRHIYWSKNEAKAFDNGSDVEALNWKSFAAVSPLKKLSKNEQ